MLSVNIGDGDVVHFLITVAAMHYSLGCIPDLVFLSLEELLAHYRTTGLPVRSRSELCNGWGVRYLPLFFFFVFSGTHSTTHLASL